MKKRGVKPLFVFGVARSGTNLIARLLNAHSKVSLYLDPFLPLFNNWLRATAQQCQKKPLSHQFGLPGPIPDYYFQSTATLMLQELAQNAFSVHLKSSDQDNLRKYLSDRISLEMPEHRDLFKSVTAETFSDFFDQALVQLARVREGKDTYCGAKEVWTTEFIPVLANMYPEARFIIIHRDPRAVIASLLKLASTDETQLGHTVSYARHWRKNVALSLSYQDSLPGRLILIRYEDLVRQPHFVCESTLSWLGLKFEEDIMSFDHTNWTGNSSFGVTSGITESSLSKWQTTLDPGCFDMIDFVCGPEMRLMGYDSEYEKGLKNTAIQHMIWANEHAGSWRSDGEDLWGSIGQELLRHNLLINKRFEHDSLIEMCFLSKKIYEMIRSHETYISES